MKADNNSHTVFANGVLADRPEIGLLVTVIELGAWDDYPSGVRCRDTKEIHSYASKLVDGVCGDVSAVMLLENRTAFISKNFTECPLVLNCSTIDMSVPEVLVIAFLDLEPISEVDTVRDEGGPISVLACSLRGNSGWDSRSHDGSDYLGGSGSSGSGSERSGNGGATLRVGRGGSEKGCVETHSSGRSVD